jgi:DNA-binding SARP family transcriptional activator/predicted ATPase
MASLHIRLLGTFQIRYHDAPVTAIYQPRQQSLLAYLILRCSTAGPQPRRQIAYTLWPDTTEEQAFTNLRRELHHLRQALPEAEHLLHAEARSLGWRAGAAFKVDVTVFEEHLARAQEAAQTSRSAEEPRSLEQAVESYGGDLLPDCYDDWIQEDRERLHQSFQHALERLILLLEEERQYAAAIGYAERLLRSDRFHEAAHRQLMRLHLLNGDRPSALRTYHTCSAMLARELGVEPSPATQELYQRTLRTEKPSPLEQHRDFAEPAAVVPLRARPVLIGRQAEWLTLRRAWEISSAGRAQFVCIAGEPGIGKTRLAEEMLHWAGQQGIAAAATRAYAGGGSLTYAPLVELLRSEALQPRVGQVAAVWRTELARLLPELLVEDPGLPRPEPLTRRGQVQRLYDAVSQVLLQPDQPMVLLLDDLQWFDTETIAWFGFLRRSDRRPATNAGSALRLLVLAVLRPEELDEGHAAVRLLLDLRHSDRLTELELAPLSAAETAELAARVADRGLDAATAAAIYHTTEGNPLFVVETVRAGLTAVSDAESAPASLIAPKVQAVIRARLAQLSPPARELAGLAAAMEQLFAYDVLALASDQDEDTVVRSLDELWRRRIVREQGANAYDFTHDRLRDIAYRDLGPVRRQLLHRRLARALETIHAQDTAPVSAHLAHHYEHAGQNELAIHYLRAAAGHAYQVYAYSESISLLNHALDLLQSLPASTARMELELELQMALCTAWAAITGYLGDEVSAAYRRALALCRQIGHMPYLFTVLWGLHEVAVYRAEYRESLELAQQCLKIAEEIDDAGLLLQAHHAAWGVYCYLGEYEEAFRHMERGLALYDRAAHERLSVEYGVHDARACALCESALALWHMGFIDQARRKLNASIAHSHELTLPANLADAAGYAGLFFHLLRDPPRAQSFAETAARISGEKGYRHSGVLGGAVLGWSLATQGHVAEGIALAEQAMAASSILGARIHRSQYAAMLAEVYILAARYEEAISATDAGIAEFGRFRDLLCAPDLWTLKGDALRALGAADDQVEACYQGALTLARELRARVSELRAALSLGRLWQSQGRQTEAHDLLTGIYGQFTEGWETADLRAARDLLAELAD